MFWEHYDHLLPNYSPFEVVDIVYFVENYELNISDQVSTL
jgi:hypothetical protein